MTKSKNKNWLVLALILLLLDQTIKLFFLKKELFVCNPGIAFGIEFNKNLIFVLNFLIIAVLIWWFQGKSFLKKEKVVFGILIGAAGSNLIDRIGRGCVVDYIDLKFWPVFNLADVLIVGSVFYLIFKIIKNS